VAEEAGILPEELEFYGPYKAKVKLEVLKRLQDRPNGKYIDVTAITDPARGRQDHYHSWTQSGAWRMSWQEGIYSHTQTLAGTNLWY